MKLNVFLGGTQQKANENLIKIERKSQDWYFVLENRTKATWEKVGSWLFCKKLFFRNGSKIKNTKNSNKKLKIPSKLYLANLVCVYGFEIKLLLFCRKNSIEMFNFVNITKKMFNFPSKRVIFFKRDYF